MEQITIRQISIIIAFLGSLISGAVYLHQMIKKYLTKALGSELQEINDNIKDLQKRVEAVDMEATKNYLVSFLSSCEKGAWQDEIEKERFWEQFEHYQRQGGNSYIKQKVEDLRKKEYL